MEARRRTIRPGELPTGVPLPVAKERTEPYMVAPATDEPWEDRLVGAVMRQGTKELAKGGKRALWIAVILLAMVEGVTAGGFALHMIGDGTVREKTDKTERLVEWLVRREVARDTGQPPPALPVELLM